MKEAIFSHFNGHYHDFYSKYLPSLKKIGANEYAALCPFHEDQKPSFNIDAQNGGYFCHGCGKKGGPFHFYAKRHGMDTKADFGKILSGIANDFGIPWTEEKRRLVKTYDYTDADGRLLFQVCRFDPKDFRQRRPNGNGGWIYDLKGIEPVLYRLPQIGKAQEVLIVEGEKDADNLCGLGFAATTAPMGSP